MLYSAQEQPSFLPSARRRSLLSSSSSSDSSSEWSGEEDGDNDEEYLPTKAFEYELDTRTIQDGLDDAAGATASMTLSPSLAPSGGVGRLLDRSGRSAAIVPLERFNHQVGGHSHIFRFSKKAVCKVL